MTYTLCLLVLAAVFVIRVLRIRARRRRERARAQLRRTEAGDGRPPPCRARREPASVNLYLLSLLPLAVNSIGWLSPRIAGRRAAWA